jgi:di/tricarboxylate transporter
MTATAKSTEAQDKQRAIRQTAFEGPHEPSANWSRVYLRAFWAPPTVAAFAATVVWSLDGGIGTEARLSLTVVTGAVIAWTMTKIDDTKIALAAVIALAITGVVDKRQIYSALGHELIWLLIASFVISSVLRASGLLERAVVATSAHATTAKQLFYSLSIAISATAFIIPSTSARAAMLVPVYLAFASRLADPGLRRALALLFPTAILLSAGASLIGAGAHVIAVETLQRTTGRSIDYIGWLLLAGPFALASTFMATWVILALFARRELLAAPIAHETPAKAPLTAQQRLIAAVIGCTVLLWILTPFHGIGIGIVAIASMTLLLAKPLAIVDAKTAFKAVEIELIVFLSMTFVLADAMTKTGADVWLARGLLHALPQTAQQSTALMVLIVAAVSLLAHLLITSRTARASVLLPALTIPLIGSGHDPTLLVMVTVLGTGFCQTMPASAKPVAIFANLDVPTYTPQDLTRLALALLPILLAGLVGYGLLMWRS